MTVHFWYKLYDGDLGLPFEQAAAAQQYQQQCFKHRNHANRKNQTRYNAYAEGKRRKPGSLAPQPDHAYHLFLFAVMDFWLCSYYYIMRRGNFCEWILGIKNAALGGEQS